MRRVPANSGVDMVQSRLITPSIYRRRECFPRIQEEEKQFESDNELWASSTCLDMGLVLDQLAEENLSNLKTIFQGTIINQVLDRCCQVLQTQTDMLIDKGFANEIFDKLVSLSELEPYGVRGGTLVVLFSPSPDQPTVKVGRFPLDPSIVSTFELHLGIQVSTSVSQRMRLSFSNLFRKLGGRPTQVLIDPKFSLTKRKLWRRSTIED